MNAAAQLKIFGWAVVLQIKAFHSCLTTKDGGPPAALVGNKLTGTLFK